MQEYIFLIDESGNVTQEAGISDDVGPSRYMPMAGVLIPTSKFKDIGSLLDKTKDEFKKKKNLHATDISHVQKIHLIRRLSEIDPIIFGVVSDKHTLQGFKTKSDGDPQDYYNRTALYLLSLLGRYLESKGLETANVKIIFEHRDHDYNRLKNYLRTVRRNPSGDDVYGIQHIQPDQIESEKKEVLHQFAIPDLVAHSIFAAFDRNRNNFSITECRYLAELMNDFWDSDDFCRLHLIQAQRMKGVCEPTIRMLNECGLAIG